MDCGVYRHRSVLRLLFACPVFLYYWQGWWNLVRLRLRLGHDGGEVSIALHCLGLEGITL